MNNTHFLRGVEGIDQEWVREIATYSSITNGYGLPTDEKKLLLRLFIDYKTEGFRSECAMKKTILVFNSIKS
jgi:hypothetical protein